VWSPVPQVTAAEAAEALAAGVASLLDVREAAEWRAGRIAGARWIPLGELPARLAELPAGRVIVVCRSGVRSDLAAEALRERGHDAVNLAGGMLAWLADGRPVEPAGGYVA
jgi:rhodanese-related sulfurtransferase